MEAPFIVASTALKAPVLPLISATRSEEAPGEHRDDEDEGREGELHAFSINEKARSFERAIDFGIGRRDASH